MTDTDGNTHPTGEPRSLASIDWAFPDADTQYLTHGFHPYPARMIPQIPSHLLNHFLATGVITPGDRLYDPFCGSGTSLVEARLHGLHGEGHDINPLACLLSKAKSIPLDPDGLQQANTVVQDGLERAFNDSTETIDASAGHGSGLPGVNDGWFPHPQLTHLMCLRDRIDDIDVTYGMDVARFFRVALSKTTRLVSYQRNGEFKRYRIPEADRAAHDPDVAAIFRSEVDANLAKMTAYAERVDQSLETTVHNTDARTATGVEANSADIVITSPPYGDHSTTVAYGQFSRDPAIISANFDGDEMKTVDKRGLGGAASSGASVAPLDDYSPALRATIESLRDVDGRVADVVRFFRDYFDVMRQVARVLRPGQPVAWVVANRTVSRVTIPTHIITRELCEHLGFEHRRTIPRDIPSKTMPWKNAPENIPGVPGDLMAEEHIVLLTG